MNERRKRLQSTIHFFAANYDVSAHEVSMMQSLKGNVVGCNMLSIKPANDTDEFNKVMHNLMNMQQQR